MNFERRYFHSKVELRAASDSQPAMVRGYAATYNNASNPLMSSQGEFVETIEPGFFDGVLDNDVRALFNHDQNLILARSNNGQGTLRLFTDDVGLGYEFTPPDTSAGRDLTVSISRGDVDSSSFAFRVKQGGDSWARQDGMLVRTLRAGGCESLLDVSPVVYPAYPDTAVSVRSLDEFLAAQQQQEKTKQPPLDLWERRLAALVR
jgi:HK97 family phage prohead protease